MVTITPVILCGGSGTRLWPLSRKDKPKPFHTLTSDKTMLAETIERCEDMGPPVLVGAAAHEELIVADMPDHAILVIEPVARNTAPAIGLAAAILPADAVMLVCPSDAYIANQGAFRIAANRAAELAEKGMLVAFGITPRGPETGYGYLKRGADLGSGSAEIERFVEKPDLERANLFLSEGGYYWNSGIFAFSAARYLEELAKFEPEMAAAVEEAIGNARREGKLIYPSLSPLDNLSGNSIDYAVMERTDYAAMVEVDMGWSDVGNWESLRKVLSGDEDGNVTKGPNELVRCRDVLTISDGPCVSAIGLDGVSIIVQGDEVLVIGPGEAQAVGKLEGVAEG